MDKFKANLVTLFVDNIHPAIDSSVLWRFISNVEEIRDVYIPRKPRMGKFFKYAFVRVDNFKPAENVINFYNGSLLKGQPILVKRAILIERRGISTTERLLWRQEVTLMVVSNLQVGLPIKGLLMWLHSLHNHKRKKHIQWLRDRILLKIIPEKFFVMLNQRKGTGSCIVRWAQLGVLSY